uniref:Uncharacterized protein n=1 Tax=Globisporangium ultimum (strain ATCC 200006 / CBS 805.95 / DAOM BR144) TaxID=431595 RepID=K3W996_GLOUD
MGFPDSSDDIAQTAESLDLGGVYALEFEHEGRKGALQMDQGGENQPITDILEPTHDEGAVDSDKLLAKEAASEQELPSSSSELLEGVESAIMSCQEINPPQDYEEPMFAHLTASVYSFYPGVLPKVRCPVCLNLMNMNQWAKFVASPESQTPVETSEPTRVGETVETVDNENTETDQAVETTATETPATATPTNDDAWKLDNSHILEKYETLCRQSCEFQSPCCHNSSYTHLPSYKTRSSDADENAQSYWHVTLPRSQAQHIPALRKRCRAFCFHREDAGVLYDFIMDTFEDNAEMIFWKVLGMIVDDERRATLLLHHLFLHPDTRTHCCDGIVCFKCKSSVHHNGQCDDFVEADCVLQCRGCRVTLVKVDGCDSVRCVCGQSIHWEAEVARQQQQRKQLAPASETEFLEWERWTRNFRRSVHKIRSLDATMREMRLNRLIRTHRLLLRAMVKRYRAAAKQNMSATSQDTGHDDAS